MPEDSARGSEPQTRRRPARPGLRPRGPRGAPSNAITSSVTHGPDQLKTTLVAQSHKLLARNSGTSRSRQHSRLRATNSPCGCAATAHGADGDCSGLRSRARHRREPRHRRGHGRTPAAGRLAGRDGRAGERRRPRRPCGGGGRSRATRPDRRARLQRSHDRPQGRVRDDARGLAPGDRPQPDAPSSRSPRRRRSGWSPPKVARSCCSAR